MARAARSSKGLISRLFGPSTRAGDHFAGGALYH
jgi:hypothetical protein